MHRATFFDLFRPFLTFFRPFWGLFGLLRLFFGLFLAFFWPFRPFSNRIYPVVAYIFVNAQRDIIDNFPENCRATPGRFACIKENNRERHRPLTVTKQRAFS